MKTLIQINPDLTEEEVQAIREALKENKGYCPCRLEQCPENKCMCQEFRNQIEGVCHCTLYKKIIVED